MRYTLTNDFTPIDATTGTVVNIGGVAVEINDEPENREGILLYPRQKLAFSDATLYAKIAAGYYGAATIAVLPVAHCSGSGGTGGTNTGIEFATDEEVREMIDNTIQKTSADNDNDNIDHSDGFATDDEVREMMRKVLGK